MNNSYIGEIPDLNVNRIVAKQPYQQSPVQVRPSPATVRYPTLTARSPACQSLPSGSLLPIDQRTRLLKVLNSYPQVQELRQWLTDAPKMMENVHGTFLSYTLGTQETISCVFWKGQHYITGTDIVKILRFRFACMNRPVGNVKKFEEGVFSDLRNLKANEHASLEEPKSEFLEFLYKHNCIRTQKKQKVFYWYEVRHDDLMLEAFERDAKRQNQAMNINNFLNSAQRYQQQQPHPQQHLGSPRLFPRMMMNPMTNPMMNLNMMNMMGYYPMMCGSNAGSEWDYPSDPAEEFIEEHHLEDNLVFDPLTEPMPKSPRLSNSTPASHIDPSLLSALPAKAQRKVQQQARTKISSLGSDVVKAKDLNSPATKDELKDPLLHDPFNIYGGGGTGQDETNISFFDLFDRPTSDPFLL